MAELGSACVSVLLCSGHVCVHMHIKINFKYFPLTDALVSGFSGSILHRADLRAHFCGCICVCQTVMPECQHNTKHLTMTSFD